MNEMRKWIIIVLLVIAHTAWGQQPVVKLDADGRAVSSSHGVYDHRDHLAVMVTYTYNDSGVVDTRTLQSYDKKGRPLRTEVYTADEYLLFAEDITYDRQGRKRSVVQVTYDEEGATTRMVFKYRYDKYGRQRIFLNGEEMSNAQAEQEE